MTHHLKLLRSVTGALLASLLCLSLVGCALPRMIDSEVESFTGSMAAQKGASYRFERLPSQQTDRVAQDRIEQWAEAALGNASLVRNDAQARYSAQVNVKVQAYQRAPQQSPRLYGPFLNADGTLWFPAQFMHLEPPWYRHTVHLLLRDIASGQIVYETTASFDGPWSDSAAILPVIFEAALRDYPAPPAGPRKVVIELAPNVQK